MSTLAEERARARSTHKPDAFHHELRSTESNRFGVGFGVGGRISALME